MPQMNPMNWNLIFFMTLTNFLVISCMSFFTLHKKNLALNSALIKTKKINFFLLKW